MKQNLISNTLAGFKKMLQSAMTNGIYVKSCLLDPDGDIAQERDFAPVGHIQSNSFALQREGKLFWVEFNKSENWEFDLPNGIATKKHGEQKTITFQFSDPAFFGVR